MFLELVLAQIQDTKCPTFLNSSSLLERTSAFGLTPPSFCVAGILPLTLGRRAE
jgi:hypothetical protein